MEVIEHGHKVAQAAGQAVKFPDNERVAVLQRLEATEQGRALGGGSRALVLKDFLAPRAFQGGELQGRVLFLGRDAGVTIFHSRDYETSNLKHPSPLFRDPPAVFHNLPFVKRAKGNDRRFLLEKYASHCPGETIDGAGSISCRGLSASEDVAHIAFVCLVFSRTSGKKAVGSKHGLGESSRREAAGSPRSGGRGRFANCPLGVQGFKAAFLRSAESIAG